MGFIIYIPCYKSDIGTQDKRLVWGRLWGHSQGTLDLARQISLTIRVHASTSKDLALALPAHLVYTRAGHNAYTQGPFLYDEPLPWSYL